MINVYMAQQVSLRFRKCFYFHSCAGPSYSPIACYSLVLERKPFCFGRNDRNSKPERACFEVDGNSSARLRRSELIVSRAVCFVRVICFNHNLMSHFKPVLRRRAKAPHSVPEPREEHPTEVDVRGLPVLPSSQNSLTQQCVRQCLFPCVCNFQPEVQQVQCLFIYI